jgi:hypothetical protein
MSTPSIGIGIATRDRWTDLAVTLETLQRNGLGNLETIVLDDGSRTPMPTNFPARFSWVRFERCEVSRGYIAQRNRLARMLHSELYLSLDDDSYPAADARLDVAAAWLTGTKDAVALAFAIHGPYEPAAPGASVRRPYLVRHYIGCAHMLKRDLFERLGGYTECLSHYCEETDFALKAWNKGYKIYKYASVVIIHAQSSAGRDPANAHRLLARNLIWVSLWRSPFLFFSIDFPLRILRMMRFKTHRVYWRAVVRGYLEGLGGVPRIARFRNPLSIRKYLAWLRNPVEQC